MKTKLPNFLCIGAQKAGTTWLDRMLRQHPDVWLPPKKELHFFDCLYFDDHKKWDIPATQRVFTQRLREERKKGVVDNKYIEYLRNLKNNHEYTLEWYRSCFEIESAQNAQIIGDITPEYSMLPTEGIEYVKEVLPNVKIIYIIRDPFDRAWSQIKMRIQRRNLDQSKIEWNKMFRNKDIKSRGNYAEYIPRWLSVFPKENILFLPFGKIKSNPEHMMYHVEHFLGLSHFQYSEYDKIVHENKLVVNKPNDELYLLKEFVNPQYDFLNSFFDKEFLDEIK